MILRVWSMSIEGPIERVTAHTAGMGLMVGEMSNVKGDSDRENGHCHAFGTRLVRPDPPPPQTKSRPGQTRVGIRRSPRKVAGRGSQGITVSSRIVAFLIVSLLPLLAIGSFPFSILLLAVTLQRQMAGSENRRQELDTSSSAQQCASVSST